MKKLIVSVGVGVPLMVVQPIFGSIVFIAVYYFLIHREGKIVAMNGKKKTEQMKKGVATAYATAEKSTPKKLGAEAMPKKKVKK